MSTQRSWAGTGIVSGIALALALCPLSARAAGELVLSFNPSMEAPPGALAATADGGFLASARGHVAKYRADGSLSSDFHSGLDDNSNFLHSFIIPDGRGNWFIGGWAVLADRRFNLVKLRASGAVAIEFEPIADTKPVQIHSSSITSFCSDGLGGGYIGGTFTELNYVAAPGLARVDDAGTVTAISRPAHLIESPRYLAVVPRGLLVVQSKDAYILTGSGGVLPLERPALGPWWSVSSAAYDPRFGIAISVAYFEPQNLYNEWIFVWDADGRLDPSFKQSVEFGSSPFLPTMKWDSAGRLIGINARVGARTAAGDFIDDGSTWGMKRLLRDGSLDPTWSRTLHFNFAQGAFCELANGDLLVSGVFTTAAGHNRTKIVRLRGSNDSAFSAVQQSTRGWVDGSREKFIMGLVIPDRGRTVDLFIRAMSASLRDYGVSDTVYATEFSVYRGQTLVRTVKGNDSTLMGQWIGSLVGAFPSTGSPEAKTILSLEPGAYTIVYSSWPGEKGEILGEVYFPN